MNTDLDEGDGIVLADLLSRQSSNDSISNAPSIGLYEQGIELEQAGQLRQAQKSFKKLLKYMPNDPRAASVQHRIAHIYFLRQKYNKAQMAYEDLLKNYGAQADYDTVINSLMELAQAQIKQRHLTWLFGGYTLPESAISTWELIVKYFPATPFAPAAQYRIGRTQQNNQNLTEAVLAYDIVLFRYPESVVAERAAISKTASLYRLSQIGKNNETARQEAWTACKVFLSMFPESEDRSKVEGWGVELYLARAQDVYNKAVFYETIALKPVAAKIYYNEVINEFAESSLTDKAKSKLESMNKKEPADA